MARRGPTAAEMHQRRRAAAAEARADRLAAGSSGAAEIAAQAARIAGLEGALAASEARALRQRNRADRLAAENRELRGKLRDARRKCSDLSWDVKVAHSYGFELERRLARCEKARFRWAQTARKLGESLKEARDELRALRAKASRSPSNSSLPPSSEPSRKKVHNSRERSGRKPGGQPGHPGHRRRLREPDEVVALAPPAECPGCGCACEPTGRSSSRQVTELVVRAHTVEYVSPEARCAGCGARLSAPFPEWAPNEANWGPSVKAAVVTLTAGCNVSVDNAVGLISELTGGEVAVSAGAACNFARQLSSLAAGEVAAVEASIGSAAVVGSDATHVRCNGAQSYVYTFNTADSALFRASARKGKAPLEGSPIDGGSQVVVHDHDTSYYSFGGGHAECNVHVMRYLKGVCENEPGRSWAADMRSALADGLELRKAALAAGEWPPDPGAVAGVESRYDAALELAAAEYERDGPFNPKYKPEGIALSGRLREYRANHLMFLRDEAVPFDNNASERNLRCCKGKTKQSGGFRSMENGQEPYCDYLTVAQTAKLRGASPHGSVLAVFEGRKGILEDAARRQRAERAV